MGRAFDPGKQHFIDSLVIRQQRLSEKNFGASQCVKGNSVRATLSALEDRGLDRACIPLSFGGDYLYYEHFDNWVRKRIPIEGALVAAPPVRNTSSQETFVAAAAVEGKHSKRNRGRLRLARGW